jgi:hypothetical protein
VIRWLANLRVRRLSALATAVVVLGFIAAALAYWTTTGTGTAQATVATISGPSNVTVQQSGANITVGWTAATLSSGGAVQGYRVARSGGASVCGTPTLVTTLSCTDTGVPVGTYTYTVTAIYHSWDSSATSSSITVLTAPTIGGAPSNPSANSAPSFSLSGGGGTSYQCRLDAGSFSTCSSPKSYSGLVDGSHTFKVHAAQGSSTGPDATYTWTIDTSAPSITAFPPNPSASASASFSFSDAQPSYTFKCQLDGAAFAPCTSPKAYSSVNDGLHTFYVEALSTDAASTAAGSYTWRVDTTAPTQSVALAGGASGAFLTGSSLYYKSNTSGSFQLVDTVSDSGSGPASAAFPSIATTGWTHAAETIATPAVGPYTSSAFTWSASPSNPASYTVTGADNAGNTNTTLTSFVSDTTAPIGGAATVNGKAASSGDPVSYSNSTSFSIGTRTNFTETQTASQSGLASSTLTVQSETLSNGTCGAAGSGGPFATATSITGTTQPSGIVTGYCYVYTLIGTDNVGNTASISTTVEVDTTPPSNGLSLNVTSGSAYLGGTTLYYRGGSGHSGSFTITNTIGAESGPASSTFGSLGGTSTGWTFTGSTVTTPTGGPYVSNSFSWATAGGGTTSSPTEAITAADNAGNTTPTTLTFTNDETAPTGGSVSYPNGYTTSPVIISFTPGTDGQSGVSTGSGILYRGSATLSGGVCGTFTFAQVGPTGLSSPYTDSALSSGNCYEYDYIVSDNVGNLAIYTSASIVKLDGTAPTQSLALAAGASGAYLTGSTLYYKSNASGSFQLVDTLTDSGSGPASASFPNISATGWTHAAETVTLPSGGPYASTAFTWSASPSSPSSYTVTGTDAVGNATTTTLTSFVSDTAAPAGGALTVNGTAASGAGSTSSATNSTSFTIGARTDFTEAQSASQSGLQSSALTVQSESLSGSTCGAPGSAGPFTTATTITGTTQPSGIVKGYCYLYKLTGTDNVGNAATVSTTVEDDSLSFTVTTQPSSATAGTATSSTAVVLTAIKNGTTDTTYTGATLTWGGANNSLSGATPTLPTVPTWTSGTATFGITLVKAESETLTVTDSTRSATFAAITVNPGTAAKLAWTSASTTSSAGIPSPCFFTCTYASGFGNGATWTAHVSVTDSLGNTVSNVGGSVLVTLTGSAGGSTNPASPATLTIPTSGAAQSTATIQFTSGNGNFTNALTATDSPYASATANFSK